MKISINSKFLSYFLLLIFSTSFATAIAAESNEQNNLLAESLFSDNQSSNATETDPLEKADEDAEHQCLISTLQLTATFISGNSDQKVWLLAFVQSNHPPRAPPYV